MRMLWFVLLVAGCWHSSPSAPPAAPRPACETWLLLHAKYKCDDIRSGLSGWWELEVVDGPHEGKLVAARYGDGAIPIIGNWNISKVVTFEPFAPAKPMMPNSCAQLETPGAQPTMYVGGIDTRALGSIETFEDEAAARAARDARCKEK